MRRSLHAEQYTLTVAHHDNKVRQRKLASVRHRDSGADVPLIVAVAPRTVPLAVSPRVPQLHHHQQQHHQGEQHPLTTLPLDPDCRESNGCQRKVRAQ